MLPGLTGRERAKLLRAGCVCWSHPRLHEGFKIFKLPPGLTYFSLGKAEAEHVAHLFNFVRRVLQLTPRLMATYVIDRHTEDMSRHV